MIDNYKDFKNFLNTIDLSNKPSLLLHTCCAPCSTHTIKVLYDYFNLTVFFTNDNIYPYEEYEKRLVEEEEYCKKLNIPVIYDTYDHNDYLDTVKGDENKGEKSVRCYKCYTLRLEKTAKKACELNFDYFSTSLSISPYKISRWINEIGYQMEEKYNIKYLFSDFKKEEGYKDSIKMSLDENMYRQDYCGCEFSKQERNDSIRKNLD